MTEIETTSIPERNHREVLEELIDLENKDVLDIGCGGGHLTRLMTHMGANVIGIDPGARQLKRALTETVGSEYYLKGTAENLPIRDKTSDIVVFFNSLHHVPINCLERALNEAYRTLKEGGILYISEPLAQGPLFELSRPFNDETLVRLEAYKAIKRSLKNNFIQDKELFYKTGINYADFHAYKENSISIDIQREKYFNEVGDKFRVKFEQLGRKEANGWSFLQVIRVNLLTAN